MNFQQVKQANIPPVSGNNVVMFGTFNEVGGISLTRNQKNVCKCQITDDSGEKHLVRLYGTMPTPALLNMRQQFTLSSYQGKNQQGQPYTGYSGFWDDRAQVNQVPANAPPAPHNVPQDSHYNYNAPQTSPQAPQAPQQPTQRPQGLNMPDTYAYPVTPETARRMARTAFITAILQNGKYPLYSSITELVEYSYTGIEPRPAQEPQGQTNPDYVGDGQEGICPHCQKPHEDCTCTIPF